MYRETFTQQNEHCDWLILDHMPPIKFKCIPVGIQLLSCCPHAVFIYICLGKHQDSQENKTNCFPRDHTLRWLKTVSSTVLFKTWSLRGHYNHSILVDANIMVSTNCPIIGERVSGSKLYICVRYSNVNVVYIWFKYKDYMLYGRLNLYHV